jgi:hypothetical protein
MQGGRIACGRCSAHLPTARPHCSQPAACTCMRRHASVVRAGPHTLSGCGLLQATNCRACAWPPAWKRMASTSTSGECLQLPHRPALTPTTGSSTARTVHPSTGGEPLWHAALLGWWVGRARGVPAHNRPPQRLGNAAPRRAARWTPAAACLCCSCCHRPVRGADGTSPLSMCGSVLHHVVVYLVEAGKVRRRVPRGWGSGAAGPQGPCRRPCLPCAGVGSPALCRTLPHIAQPVMGPPRPICPGIWGVAGHTCACHGPYLHAKPAGHMAMVL